MNKWWLVCVLVLGFVLISGAGSGVAYAQGDVTFQVNMSIKMLEGAFDPGAGDIVRVAGSFNGWGGSTDTLSDGDADSIYTKEVTGIATGDVQYKFLKTLRGGLDWENVPDRPYTVVAGAQTLPVVFFDNDSVFTPPMMVPVTFQVDMSVKILEQAFLPGSGDIVRVAGSFNGWGGSVDTLNDSDNDSIYTKSVDIQENSAIQYKFLKTPRAGLDWENVPDRQYTVPPGGGPVPVAFFDDDAVVNTPVTANILWKADMNVFINQLGWLRPDLGDSMEVRGGFNGWSDVSKMDDPLGTGVYEFVTSGFMGTTGDELQHKYFMDFDSAGATQRFPNYVHSGGSATRDGHAFEHPAERGDGNRIFLLIGGGNVATDVYWFSDMNSSGVLNAGDSVTVTLNANMGPATRYVDPFVPGTDTVRAIWFDDLTRSAQAALQGSFSGTINMSPVSGPTDTIYQGTFTIVGPTHYNFLYYYRYIHPAGGGQQDEGGGLGAQNPFRSRFVQPLGANSFPRFYSAPQDEWQKNAPMPAETAPFNPLTSVSEDPTLGVPLAYKLTQNYPNPFNPSTRIKYSIPERANVTLKVYNLLGQEVATLINEEQPQGNYVALFEGNTLATGVYFYRLEAGKFKQTMKMLLLK